MSQKLSKKTTKTIEEKYQKKTPIEHILTRPDTYIGDVKIQKEPMWIYSSEKNMLVEKEINYVPGLYKIFDEIIVNASDRIQEDPTCNIIKVNIDVSNNMITVWNNGIGIDVVIHQEHNLYIPSLIFGELLTSTNYDDTTKRTTGGRNGYGAKLANIYSTFFSVETVDGERKLKFYQEFRDNMGVKSEPKISKIKSESPKTYTQISFQPELVRFGLTELTADIVSLFEKRVYDLAGINNSITVFLNDKKIIFNNFKKYIEFHHFDFNNVESKNDLSDDDLSDTETSKISKPDKVEKLIDNIIFEDTNERWKVGVIYAPNHDFKQISFVNGICTYHGGSHVDYITNNIIDKIKIQISKKHKDLVIKPSAIKENMIIFINAIIENPAFTSQVKENLKTKASEFGSTCDLSDKFIKKLYASGIVDQVINLVKLKEQSLLKKTDGKKTTKISGIPKLEDANWAGTKKSNLCKLILTEGDSAMAFALAGRSVVGSDMYGVFPLKGKLLNVREARSKQIMDNEEIKNIKKIIGLQQGKTYNDISDLRYGGVILLTDSDVDGHHIKGLLINFIHYFWPSLIKLNTFIFSLQTPIVKATKGKEIKQFYNLTDYEDWKKNTNLNPWRIKYYKGLGTSTTAEAKEYFTDLEDKLIKYTYENQNGGVDNIKLPTDTETDISTITIKKAKKTTEQLDSDEDDNDDTIIITDTIKAKYNDETTESITLAFEKERSNDRKTWIMNYDRNNVVSHEQLDVPIPTFINKELIHFSYDDCDRSIPSVCDGLKPSQRKVLYGSFLKKIYLPKDEIRVSQLASYISEKTCYHHGEASVIGTIVKMAQNFVGANNINLLFPNGQFGTRLVSGGSDHASARYINTYIEELSRLIFRYDDDAILNLLDDDGTLIEPEWFIPILPMVLVNGCKGIGTGFSTTVPQFNPKDIVSNLLKMMDRKPESDLIDMKPWYKGYKGTILNSNKIGSYLIYGKYQIIDETSLRITELPIGTWTRDYKEFLDAEVEKKFFNSYTSNITDETFDFTITMDEDKLQKLIKTKTLYTKLKLVSRISTRNMYLYNPAGGIKRYDTANDILNEFYDVRIEMYRKRKEHLIIKIKNELNILEYKMKFIKNVLDGDIIVFKQKKADIIKKLIELKFPKLMTRSNTKKNDDDNDDLIDDLPEENMSGKTYDYITSLPLFSLTQEKIDELQDKLNAKIEELNKVETTSCIDQWRLELEEFLVKYEEWINFKPEVILPKTKVTKKVTKKTVKNSI